jgi:hypothetical protein
MIQKIFGLLDDWRKLPAYQLERRADIFFAIYLDKIIKSKYNKTVKIIIPEFPVRAGEVVVNHKRPDLSFKIDYAVLCDDDKTVYLIELKTDQSSRRPEQDSYLKKAKEINIPGLINGIIKIYFATDQKYKKKYDYLLNKLSQIGWINRENLEVKSTAKNYDITVVYIQPRNEQNLANTISFDNICSFLPEQDDLTKRFIESLKEWRLDPI